VIVGYGCQKENTGIPSSSSSASVTDDLNNSISFDEIPQRVITLAPNLTEFIYALGVEDKLVGNTLYCNYPPAADSVTKVGDMLTFDYEKILTLKPDLIFITVEGNRKEAYGKLKNLGLKVFVSNPRDFKGIKKTFTDMGKIFGKENYVTGVINKWDSTYNFIERNSKKFTPEKTMILIELNPLMVAGKNTFINGYIKTCNMENFVKDTTLNYPVFSREIVLEENPEIIVYPSDGSTGMKTILDVYPEWNKLSAVKNGNVFFVNRDLYFRPGPRFIDALENFYNRLKVLL